LNDTPVRVVIVLDDLDPVRSHAVKRRADLVAAAEMEPEVHERLRRSGILPRVQRHYVE
jgi:hypothetical protein